MKNLKFKLCYHKAITTVSPKIKRLILIKIESPIEEIIGRLFNMKFTSKVLQRLME
jgi:hypothetical protein